MPGTPWSGPHAKVHVFHALSGSLSPAEASLPAEERGLESEVGRGDAPSVVKFREGMSHVRLPQPRTLVANHEYLDQGLRSSDM